ncbi:hypothetical protein ACGFSD_23955 [Streptomyces caniferus]
MTSRSPPSARGWSPASRRRPRRSLRFLGESHVDVPLLRDGATG